MPVRWQVDGNWTIAANSIQYWTWNFFTDPGPTGGPNQGPIVFRAIPKGRSQGGNNIARNVLVTYDFAMCRGGPGDDHAPEVFYEFKIRNDSSIAVPFMLQFIKFSDLPLNTKVRKAMTIMVITDDRSNIVGTAGKRASTKPEAGTGGPIAGPGQSVYEIELPKGLVGVEDVVGLYAKLQEHLKK